MALSEWGLTPEYVTDSWSPEILWLMIRERLENIRMLRKMERDELSRIKHRGDDDMGPRRVVSDTDLFKVMKIDTRP